MKIALVLIAVQFAAASFATSLTEIQQKLDKSGKSWVAKENPISSLSKEQKKRLLGAQVPELEQYFVVQSRGNHGVLPSHYDWRDVNGVNFESPVLNQGDCGSCVAFAAIGTLETQMNITWNTPFSPWSLSEQHLFACGGGGCETGWQPDSAVQYLQSSGVPDSACFPYVSGQTGKDQQCSQTCSDATNRSLKIVGSTNPTSLVGSPEDIKAALLKGPLITTMLVYDDFFYYSSGVYKHVDGDMAGGHAISIVGYDEQEQSWIVKNSWGDEWGDHGFFRIAWDDASQLGMQTWGLEVPQPNGYVALKGVHDRDVFSGTVNLDVESTYTNTSKKEWALNQGTQQIATGQISGTSVGAMDTTTVQDGNYLLVAKATHDTTVSQSEPRMVAVLNGKLTGQIDVKNLTEGQTLSSPDINIELDVTSTPILPAKIMFSAKNLDTGKTYYRGTNNVANVLIFHWRYARIPNGKYEINFVGTAGNQTISAPAIHVTIQH